MSPSRPIDAVAKDVLAVARAEMEAAEHVEDFGVHAVDADFLGGFLPFFLNVGFDFPRGVVEDFLDPRGVDAAVGDQLVQRLASDLAPHGIEAADDDDARRVVDDDINAGDLFERADVASFAANDPALHLVAGNIDGAGGAFGGMGGGVAL
jgi:hypothetical protein